LNLLQQQPEPSKQGSLPQDLMDYMNTSGLLKQQLKQIPTFQGWNNRKEKTITGTTAGAQTNYQMKLKVYKGSGTDTPGTVYLGGNARKTSATFGSQNQTASLCWITG